MPRRWLTALSTRVQKKAAAAINVFIISVRKCTLCCSLNLKYIYYMVWLGFHHLHARHQETFAPALAYDDESF